MDRQDHRYLPNVQRFHLPAAATDALHLCPGASSRRSGRRPRLFGRRTSMGPPTPGRWPMRPQPEPNCHPAVRRQQAGALGGKDCRLAAHLCPCPGPRQSKSPALSLAGGSSGHRLPVAVDMSMPGRRLPLSAGVSPASITQARSSTGPAGLGRLIYAQVWGNPGCEQPAMRSWRGRPSSTRVLPYPRDRALPPQGRLSRAGRARPEE